MKDRVRALLDDQTTPAGRAVGLFIMTLIALSCASVIVETLPSLPSWARPWLRLFEVFSVAVFTVEYLLRLWSSPRPLNTAGKPMMVVDLLAILPFYVGLVAAGGLDLRFLRILRGLRVLRLLKMHRYSRALTMLVVVVRTAKHQLVAFCFVALLALVLVASAMYYVEPGTFVSIPDALWWSIVTLTTVGYGDVIPTSPLGKALAGVIMLIGIGIIAIPTGIISSGMTEYYQRGSAVQCRGCGLTAHDQDATHCKHCGMGLEVGERYSLLGAGGDDANAN